MSKEFIFTPDPDGYEDVFDEDGNEVNCDECSSLVKWRDGKYVCPDCGRVFERNEFFDYIGANPPGVHCYTCDSLYPGCITCPYGYLSE